MTVCVLYTPVLKRADKAGNGELGQRFKSRSKARLDFIHAKMTNLSSSQVEIQAPSGVVALVEAKMEVATTTVIPPKNTQQKKPSHKVQQKKPSKIKLPEIPANFKPLSSLFRQDLYKVLKRVATVSETLDNMRRDKACLLATGALQPCQLTLPYKQHLCDQLSLAYNTLYNKQDVLITSANR